MAKVLTRVIRQLFSKGNSLAQSESRGQASARVDGFLICMTSARAAQSSPCSPPVLHPLLCCRRTVSRLWRRVSSEAIKIFWLPPLMTKDS